MKIDIPLEKDNEKTKDNRSVQNEEEKYRADKTGRLKPKLLP